MSSIGSRIRNIRDLESRASFAEKLCIGTATLQRYEGDERSPDIDFLVRLQKLTGYSLDYLIYGKESSLIKEEALLLEKYRQANAETKNKILLLLLGNSEIPNSSESVIGEQQAGDKNGLSTDQQIKGNVKIKSKGKRAQAAFNISNNDQ